MRRPTDRQLQLLLVSLYIVSRILFHMAGVRFDLRPLETSWHILDPVLLRDELLLSALVTPGQPPLYNLILGGVGKLSDDPALLAHLYRVLFAGMALATCLLTFGLLRRLQVGSWFAFLASALFMLSPALVLYESLPYYSVMVLLMLTLACLLFQHAVSTGSQSSFFGLFLALAALIWLRAMFQIHWFVVLLGFCLLARPERTRVILRAASLPLLLVLLLYGKNAAITGYFATSSWLGMSLVKHTVHQLPLAQRESLVVAGVLSALALRETTYDRPEELPEFFQQHVPTGVPVLDQGTKSTGHVSYHHLAYVEVSRAALRDALYVVVNHPAVYLRSVSEAFLMFFRPASDYPYLRPNRDAIEPWGRLYGSWIAGQPRYPVDPWFAREPGTMGYTIMVGYIASILFGFTRLLRRPWRASANDLTIAFLWLNVVYVSLVGNALEIGENQRFRFTLHPLLIITLCVLTMHALTALRRRVQRSHA